MTKENNPNNFNRREFWTKTKLFLGGVAGAFIINSCKAEIGQTIEPNKATNSLQKITSENWKELYKTEKVPENIANLFRQHFNLPANQEIQVIAASYGNDGAYGPVLVARPKEGADINARDLVYAFFPTEKGVFKGIVLIKASKEKIEIETKSSSELKIGESFPVNINFQATKVINSKIEKIPIYYNLVVQIDSQSHTYTLSKEQILAIFGPEISGAFYYLFTNIAKRRK